MIWRKIKKNLIIYYILITSVSVTVCYAVSNNPYDIWTDFSLKYNNEMKAISAAKNAISAAKSVAMEILELKMLAIQEINAKLIEAKGRLGIYEAVKSYQEIMSLKDKLLSDYEQYKYAINQIKSFEEFRDTFQFDLTTLEKEMEERQKEEEERFNHYDDLRKKAIAKNAAAGEYFEQRVDDELKRISTLPNEGTNQFLQTRNELLYLYQEQLIEEYESSVRFHEAQMTHLSNMKKKADDVEMFSKIAGTPEGSEAAVQSGNLTQPLPIYWR